MRVKVINKYQLYSTYSTLAKKYTKNGFWFSWGSKVENGDELELIECVDDAGAILAVCYDDKKRIIIIGQSGIEEIEEKLKEELNMGDFKKGDICEVINGWGMSFKVIGTKVRVVSDVSMGYVKVEKLDNGTRGTCLTTSIRKFETPLLPVGTNLKLIQPVLGCEDMKVGTIGVVAKATSNRALIRLIHGGTVSINEQALKEEWEVVPLEWSEWQYSEVHNYEFRVKGKKVQVRKDSYIGTALCSPLDSFNLSTGLDIASNRADIEMYNAKIKAAKEKIERY